VPWKLTVRAGSQVTRERFEDLGVAIDAVEARAIRLARKSHDSVDAKFKRFDPVDQVVARLELAGPERLIPRLHGGIDVRGDGSIEPYLGRVSRTVVELRKGESPYEALRRALTKP
jgi:hypothetical protein